MCNSKETNNLWSYGVVYVCIYNKMLCSILLHFNMLCSFLVKIDAKMELFVFQRVAPSWSFYVSRSPPRSHCQDKINHVRFLSRGHLWKRTWGESLSDCMQASFQWGEREGKLESPWTSAWWGSRVCRPPGESRVSRRWVCLGVPAAVSSCLGTAVGSKALAQAWGWVSEPTPGALGRFLSPSWRSARHILMASC